MKLASLRNGTRDGQLLVVSRDLARALPVPHIAPTLQAALDDWSRLAPRLEQAALDLEDGRAPGSFPFQATQVLAPPPRAHHWVDGSAYVNHVELVPIGTSSVTTATSASRSMPNSSLGTGTSAVGGRKSSDPPW